MREFYVYILSSKSHRLYVGVTNDLVRRLWEHRQGIHGFTARYRINRLVHFEVSNSPMAAIGRKKELKGWLRKRKIELIESTNPTWLDLSKGWF